MLLKEEFGKKLKKDGSNNFILDKKEMKMSQFLLLGKIWLKKIKAYFRWRNDLRYYFNFLRDFKKNGWLRKLRIVIIYILGKEDILNPKWSKFNYQREH